MARALPARRRCCRAIRRIRSPRCCWPGSARRIGLPTAHLPWNAGSGMNLPAVAGGLRRYPLVDPVCVPIHVQASTTPIERLMSVWIEVHALHGLRSGEGYQLASASFEANLP